MNNSCKQLNENILSLRIRSSLVINCFCTELMKEKSFSLIIHVFV